MGIACLGLQIATTVVYAYTTDVSGRVMSWQHLHEFLTDFCQVL
jgi:hypothetical protein